MVGCIPQPTSRDICMADKARLSDKDWMVLFPDHPFKIGETILFIKPLTLIGVSRTMGYVKLIGAEIQQAGLDLTNLQKNVPQMVALVTLILTHAPQILSELSGLDENDVQRLPLPIAIDLFSICLEVNLQSQEGLTKNFKRLGDQVVKLTTESPLA